MAAGVSINMNFIQKGLIFSTLLVISVSFEGVPYRVDSPFDENVQVSSMYSIHRSKRQSGTGASLLPNQTISTTVSTASAKSTVAVTSTTQSTNTTTTTASVTSTARPTTSTQASTTTTTAKPMGSTTPRNSTVVQDSHRYYSSRTIVDERMAMTYWVDLDDMGITSYTHKTLSDSHRTAATVKLKFEFPFYGHMMKQVTIATGGFLYVSDFLHRWLTATQYIAPLMANFDTTIADTSSNIRYTHNEEMMVVQWENVHLQDQKEYGGFTFQCIIHKNGKIIFVYKKIPKALQFISMSNHPVKIGLSDAYYSDRVEGNLRRRTIVEYHRVTLDKGFVENNTAIVLMPVKTCISIRDCDECLVADIGFTCAWCGKLKKCSDGMDRGRQLWQQVGCRKAISDPCPDKGNTTMHKQTTFSMPVNKSVDGVSSQSITTLSMPLNKSAGGVSALSIHSAGSGSEVALAIVLLVIIVVAISAVIAFFVYAYKNPNSRSGIWLIEHRPSKIATNIASKIRFWRGSSANSGDKYEVSITPGKGNESTA